MHRAVSREWKSSRRPDPSRVPGRPRSDRKTPFLPTALVWVLMVYLTVPFTIFTPPSELSGNGMAPNAVSRLIKLVLLAIAVALMLRRWAAVRQMFGRLNVFFLAFLVLAPLSSLWSISRSDTIARYASILCTVGVCAAYCVNGWQPRKWQEPLRQVITVLLLGSVIFVLVDPVLAIQHDVDSTARGAWHGLAGQKNPFGDLASFGLIFWLHGWLARQVGGWKALLGGGLALGCLIMSRSQTSLMATVFVAVLLLMLLRTSPGVRRYMPYLVPLFAVLVVVYALAVLNLVPGSGLLLQPITAITGKDMTFSNRSEIWAIIEQQVAQSPWLGSGYGAYWIGPVPTSPSYIFLSRMYFYPTESHNGYLEIVNDLGYVGLVCLLGYLVVFVRQSLKLLRVERAQGALFLAIFFQQAIVNLAESCWLHSDSGFIFATVTMATFALARALTERERESDSRALLAQATARSGRRQGPQRLART
jgi:exopolysaccharide production protein ExoQ